jgi:CDP-6-deoxy-D-xylo-4-hexulose-3-dehydrase
MKNINYSLSENTFGTEEKNSIINLINSPGKLSYGKNVKLLEKSFAKLNKRKFCVMVNSGSSANLLGVASLIYDKKFNLFKGDEVIVPSLSWSTTYTPLIQLGLKLIFIDVDLFTLNINADLVENAITKKTKAIFAVNILGLSCDYKKLKKICKKYNLILMEDNCESLMSKNHNMLSGSHGIFSTCSSFYSHHFCTIEGGYLLTNNFRLYCNALSLRSHGWIREQPLNSHLINKKYTDFEKLFKFILPGFNLRPTEINAKLGLIQLKKLNKFIINRRENAKKVYNIFKGLKSVFLQKYEKNSSFFGFAFILKNKLKNKRKYIVNYMKKNKIECRPIVSGDITKNPMIKYAKFKIPFKLKCTQYIDQNGFMIGNRSRKMTEKEIKILNKFNNFLKKYK